MGAFFIGVLVFFGAAFVGLCGFCQIVGSFRYGSSHPIANLIIWGGILAVAWLLVHSFLSDYQFVLYIGYGVALIFSFSVKPDGAGNNSQIDHKSLQRLFYCYKYISENVSSIYDECVLGIEDGSLTKKEGLDIFERLLSGLDRLYEAANYLYFPDDIKLAKYRDEIIKVCKLFIVIIRKQYDILNFEIAEEEGTYKPRKRFDYDDVPFKENIAVLKAEYPFFCGAYDDLEAMCKRLNIPTE